MAKRKMTTFPEDNAPDYLKKTKKEFEADLAERIKIGIELYERQINGSQDFGKLMSDYNFWHDFNRELLNRAFNKTNNQYYKEYIREPSTYVTSLYHGAPSLSELIQEMKGNIAEHTTRLQKIKGKLVLIDELSGLKSEIREPDKPDEDVRYLAKLFGRFHRAAQSLRHRHDNRETLMIKDEYDVQDLLRSLLHIHFDDIREEEYSPGYAGGNSRIDFVLKNEKIVVETKMTNDRLRDKEIGSQLLIDIGRYRSHPDCKVLVVFIYDKGDHIRNKAGLISDLQKMSSADVLIKVFIGPE